MDDVNKGLVSWLERTIKRCSPSIIKATCGDSIWQSTSSSLTEKMAGEIASDIMLQAQNKVNCTGSNVFTIQAFCSGFGKEPVACWIVPVTQHKAPKKQKP